MATISRPAREYVDLDFNFEKHPVSNNISIKRGVAAVRQSVINLMILKEGEKPFHPEIQSPVYAYLFEPASSIIKVVLEGEVIRYLNVYEPRIIIDSVSISFDEPNAISCTIKGTIINISENVSIYVLIDRLR